MDRLDRVTPGDLSRYVTRPEFNKGPGGDGSTPLGAAAGFTSASKFWVSGRTVTVLLNATNSANSAGNAAITVAVPVGGPGGSLYFWAADAATAAAVLCYIDSAGVVRFVLTRTTGQGVLGSITYLTGTP